jgi:hypothetical protein
MRVLVSVRDVGLDAQRSAFHPCNLVIDGAQSYCPATGDLGLAAPDWFTGFSEELRMNTEPGDCKLGL